MSDEELIDFEISFPEADERDANTFALELVSAIQQSTSQATVTQKRETETSQDLGSIVTVVVGSTAITAVGIGIQNWLTQRSKARLKVSRGGEVVAENIESGDAVKIVESIAKIKK